MNKKKFFAPSTWRLGGANGSADVPVRIVAGLTPAFRRAAIALLTMVLTATTAGAQEVEFTFGKSQPFYFTGHQIKPRVTKVTISNNNVTTEYEPSQFSVTYGTNMDSGENRCEIEVTITAAGVYQDCQFINKYPIAKRPITVNINNCEKYNGADDPAFTWEMVWDNAVQQDSLFYLRNYVLSKKLNGHLSRTAGETLGDYTISYDGTNPIEFSNYLVTVNPGTLSILPPPITYIDENGVEQTINRYLPLTGDETNLSFGWGWYAVRNTNPNGVDLAYTKGLTCDGDIHLILCDGAEMTVTAPDANDAITLDGESTLTIYGQSQQSGKLTLTGSESGQCIYSSNIVMNGGIVNATTGTAGTISCSSFTMNGGSFSATSNSDVYYHYAIQFSNSFTFNGGNFSATATSSYGIAGREGMPVNLSWTRPSDSFYASSFLQVDINIAEGRDFIDELGSIHTSKDVGEIDGKMLRPNDKPLNLTAGTITLTSATLNWEVFDNETQWQVRWSTDDGETWNSPVTVNQTQYTITDLTPGTTVKVEVWSIYGEDDYSHPATCTFTTHLDIDAPVDLANAVTATTATLSWMGFQEEYNVRYCTFTYDDAVTATEDFEHSGSMPEGWTKLDLGDGKNTEELGITADAKQNGSYGFRFSSFSGSSDGSFDQYLISPELNNLSALSFYYRASETDSSGETFRVGYSTTTNDVSAFTWVSNGTTSSTEFSEFVATNIPAKAKYFAINYTAVYRYRLYIDNITYTYTPLIFGSWNETNTNVTSPLTITGLTPETNYLWQVQGINASCDDGTTEWSEMGTFTTNSILELADDDSENFYGEKNADLISGDDGTAKDVMLTGRTLWKDGAWNTLCLPFALSAAQIADSPLAGADIRTLSDASFSADGTLTLDFTPAPGQAGALTTIEAGKPYIIKWAEPAGYVAYNGENATTCSDIVNPVFRGVTLDATDRSVSFDLDTTEGQEKGITFCGTYDMMTFDAAEPSILFLGGSNTLYYPQSGAKIGAQRAYFQLDGLTAGDAHNNARQFVLNFGENSSETKIISPAEIKEIAERAAAWFDLNGRRLSGKPTKKGLYIVNGKKVVIK